MLSNCYNSCYTHNEDHPVVATHPHLVPQSIPEVNEEEVVECRVGEEGGGEVGEKKEVEYVVVGVIVVKMRNRSVTRSFIWFVGVCHLPQSQLAAGATETTAPSTAAATITIASASAKTAATLGAVLIVNQQQMQQE